MEITGDGIESCWVENMPEKEKYIVIGCIYRHPTKDCAKLHNALKEQLSKLNNRGKEVFLLGFLNIDLLNYTRDNQTSEYLDMLLDLGYMPLITKATRITDHTATLIDHIYTNLPQKITKAGICLADITDHLPVYCTVRTDRLPLYQETKYFQDFSHFDKHLFLNDLENIDFNQFINEDVNESVYYVINALQTFSDQHAPVKKTIGQKNKAVSETLVIRCYT